MKNIDRSWIILLFCIYLGFTMLYSMETADNGYKFCYRCLF